MIMTLTPVTLTLNAFSTAALIWGLFARMSTSKTYLFAIESPVPFSVIRGRRSIAKGLICLSTRHLRDRRPPLSRPVAAPQRLRPAHRLFRHQETVVREHVGDV